MQKIMQPTSDKASTYSFNAEFFEEDFTGAMSWGVLGKRILRASAQHADDRNFERVQCNGRTYLWVLSRMVIEMDRMPHTGDKGSITTWLTSVQRCFVGRCYVLRDEAGNVYGRVTSVWALIDSESRNLVNPMDVIGEKLTGYVDADNAVDLGRCVRINTEGMQTAERRKIYCSDLDKNGHLNSIRYIDFALDTFPKETFETMRPCRVELAYNRESVCGDDMDIMYKQAKQDSCDCEQPRGTVGQHLFALCRRGKVACTCAITLCNK